MRTFAVVLTARDLAALNSGVSATVIASCPDEPGVDCVNVELVPDVDRIANDTEPGIREEEWLPRSLRELEVDEVSGCRLDPRPDRARALSPEEAGRVLGGMGLATSAEAEAAWAGDAPPPLLSPRDVLLMRAKELHAQAGALERASNGQMRRAEAAKNTAAQYEKAAATLASPFPFAG